MTLEQIANALNAKMAEPSADGTVDQVLTPSGWVDLSLGSSYAQQVEVDGVKYKVRTGTAGNANYLTLGTNTLWLGTKTVSGLYIGTSQVTSIYTGTTEAYALESGEYKMWYNGPQNSIAWRGNYLPRPQYTDYAEYAVDTSITYILMYVSQHSSYSFNTHVITQTPITVPKRSTTMHVYCRAYTNSGGYICFGMLPSNAPTSYSTANGGLLSSETQLTETTTWHDITLNISSLQGRTNLYPVVNWRAAGDTRKDVHILRIYFS